MNAGKGEWRADPETPQLLRYWADDAWTDWVNDGSATWKKPLTAAAVEPARAPSDPRALAPPEESMRRGAIAGWYEDPVQDGRRRFWDGMSWLMWVSAGGPAEEDPLPEGAVFPPPVSKPVSEENDSKWGRMKAGRRFRAEVRTHGTLPAAADGGEPTDHDSHDLLRALSRSARKAAQQQMSETDEILFVLVGASSQALVALEDRVMILKPGFMANTTGGCRTTVIAYRDMTGITANTGMLMGAVMVTSAGYPARPVDYWSAASRAKTADANSPFVIPNCIPIAKKQLADWEPNLAELRNRMNEARQPATAPPKTHDDLADQLIKLANLHSEGVLSDAEFQAAKGRLLGDS